MGDAENAGWALRGIRAYAEGDLEPVLGRVRADAEWWPPVARVQGAPYVGPDGVERWKADLREAFEWLHTDDVEIRTRPGVVLVRGRFRARARESGVEIAEPILHVFRFDGEMVAGYESILQPSAKALEKHGWEDAVPQEADGV